MTLKVYAAGSSKEMDRALDAIEFVQSVPGMELTFNWHAAIQKKGGPGVNVHEIGKHPIMRENAEADFEGVRNARVLWLLWPYTDSTGAWAELGMAIMAKRILGGPRRIFVSWPKDVDPKYHIFLELPGIEIFDSDADVRDHLMRMRIDYAGIDE